MPDYNPEDGALKIYGLVGYPVKHSLSPLMHNAAFKTLNLNAEYKLFEKKAPEIPDFFNSLMDAGIAGLNVTFPYKETVKEFIDEYTPEASLIGAVNTVRIEKNKKTGHNTDGIGFIRHLAQVYRSNLKGISVFILGAGGAARAIVFSLARCDVGNIVVYDIDHDKAKSLSEEVMEKSGFTRIGVADSADELLQCKPELLINATPVGMKEDDPVLIKAESLFPYTFVYDLIYKPAETKLLRLAGKRGLSSSNGLGMLLYQGAESFEFWTGLKAPVEVMRRTLTAVL